MQTQENKTDSYSHPKKDQYIEMSDQQDTDQQNNNSHNSQQYCDVRTKKQTTWSTYRILFSYAFIYWHYTLILNICMIVATITQSYLPLLMGHLLDQTTQINMNQEKHKQLTYEFIFVMLVYACGQFMSNYVTELQQIRIYNSLRQDILEQFLLYDINFYNSYNNGEIISRMTNDIKAAKSIFSTKITLITKCTFTIIINIIIMLVLSIKLTLAILILVPFYTYFTYLYSSKGRQLMKLKQENLAKIISINQQTVQQIVTIQSFCAERKELQRFIQALDENIPLANSYGLNEGIFQFTNAIFNQSITLIVLYYGGRLIYDHEGLTAGELASFIFYSIQTAAATSDLRLNLGKLIVATGSFQGVLDMLAYVPLVQEINNPIRWTSKETQINFQDVSFAYPNVPDVIVLKNLNFTISSGEYVAMVGTSGSGKSTVTYLLERFYDPINGQISINQENIKNYSLKSLRSSIGLVSQQPDLFEGTIQSNIVYGVDETYSYEDFEWATKSAGVWNFVKGSNNFPNGFDTFVGEHGSTLSGGQKQRIAIARALIKRPKILIFDEATSALDAESEFQVQSAVDDLIRNTENQITIIVIAHRLSTIVNCHRIMVFQHGQIVEQGTHEDLLSMDGIYMQLVQKQLHSKKNDE